MICLIEVDIVVSGGLGLTPGLTAGLLALLLPLVLVIMVSVDTTGTYERLQCSCCVVAVVVVVVFVVILLWSLEICA